MKWARTIIILAFIALAGFLAALRIDPEKICLILGAVATPAGLYIGLKGKGHE